MDIFNQKDYRIIKNLASFLGLWPYQTVKERLFFGGVTTLLCFGIYLPEVTAAVLNFHNKEVMIELFGPFLVDIISIVKYISYTYNYKKIRSLFDQMKSDLSGDKNTDDYSIFQAHANLGKFFARGYLGMVYSTMTAIIMEPLFSRVLFYYRNTNETLPLRFSAPIHWFGIDMDKWYYFIMVVSAICIVAVISITVVSDTIFIIFLEHAAGLFAVAGYMMENIPVLKNDQLYSSSKFEILQYNHYVESIKKHKRAIKFAEDLESIYVWCFGVVVLLNVPLMSVTATQITVQSTNIEQMLRYAMSSFGLIVHLFFDCFLSQQLIDYSSNIQKSILNGQWYNTSLRVQKLVILVALRSQIPSKLTAGKIIVLSLETFSSFLKTAASYFTMLASMQ